MQPRHQNTLLLALLFLITLVAYTYFNRDNNRRDHSVESRMALVKALVEERRLEIDSFHNTLFSTSDKAFYDGHYYSDKAIGISLLGAFVYKLVLVVGARLDWVIPFRIFRDVITIFTVSVLSALIAPLLYLVARRVNGGLSAGAAALIALGIALGTPYFKFSTFFYGHAPAGLFLLAAVCIWFAYHQDGRTTGARVLLSGFLLGWMVLTEYPTVLLAGAAGLYILAVLRQHGRLLDWKMYALIAAGAIIPIGILLFYNYAAFGNALTPGYSHEAAASFNAAHNTGLFGVSQPDPGAIFYMTFHHTMGIFWQSPLLLLALPGWYLMLKSSERRLEGWFSLLTFTGYLVFMSGYYWWWGYAFTPRHIIPVLPLFVLPLAALPKKYFPLLAATGALSVLQMLIVAAGNSDGLPELLVGAFEAGTIARPGSIIYSIYLVNILNGLFVHNLGEWVFGLRGPAMFVPLAIGEAVLVAALVWTVRRIGSAPAAETAGEDG